MQQELEKAGLGVYANDIQQFRSLCPEYSKWADEFDASKPQPVPVILTVRFDPNAVNEEVSLVREARAPPSTAFVVRESEQVPLVFE
jgi:hypothetical protein